MKYKIYISGKYTGAIVSAESKKEAFAKFHNMRISLPCELIEVPNS